jgi:pimeloyl-ACP methyl ester carboxylesterase
MSRTIDLAGRTLTVAELGSGEPLLYLHGFADIHASTRDWLAFHRELGRALHLYAPPHPGCADAAEDEDIDTIDDAVFHYLRVIDALRLARFHLAGSSIGGWIAAEIAVHIPERVRSLSLIAPTGLFVPGEPIGDIFMMAQARDGTNFADFRHGLFRSAEAPEALAMFPDGMMPAEREMLRYRMFRFASRIGFMPPYLYDRRLRGRLDRYVGPATVIAGEHDHLVPRAHAETYAAALRGAELHVVAGAGHSVIVEKPGEAAERVLACVQRAGALAA